MKRSPIAWKPLLAKALGLGVLNLFCWTGAYAGADAEKCLGSVVTRFNGATWYGVGEVVTDVVGTRLITTETYMDGKRIMAREASTRDLIVSVSAPETPPGGSKVAVKLVCKKFDECVSFERRGSTWPPSYPKTGAEKEVLIWFDSQESAMACMKKAYPRWPKF